MSRFPASGAALIIGGSGGIGQAIATTLAKSGSAVALTYYKGRERAEAAAASITGEGGKPSLHAVDLKDFASTQKLVAEVLAAHGALHTLVYAAGPLVPLIHLSKIAPEQMAAHLEADTLGFFHSVRAALPHLRDTKGSIVACTTTALRRYAPADGLSVIPKAGVEALVRGFAKEEGRFGVRANAVAIGLINSGQFHTLREQGHIDATYMEMAARATPLQRIGEAEDIAEAVAFLASSKAGFITGQVIAVDGGYAV